MLCGPESLTARRAFGELNKARSTFFKYDESQWKLISDEICDIRVSVPRMPDGPN